MSSMRTVMSLYLSSCIENSGRYSVTGLSNSTLSCCTKVKMLAAVKILLIEPIIELCIYVYWKIPGTIPKPEPFCIDYFTIHHHCYRGT